MSNSGCIVKFQVILYQEWYFQVAKFRALYTG